MAMKRIFQITMIVISLLTTGWLASLFPPEDGNTSHAQPAYPPPSSGELLDPYPPPPTAYPGPQESQATPSSIPTSTPELASISITISVEGLKDGNEAQVSLLPFSENLEAQVQSVEAVLPSITFSDGDHNIRAENIPTGVYKLIIQGSPEYFRNPKGYIIRVQKEIVDQPVYQLLRFNLVSSKETNLPPCREIVVENDKSGVSADLGDIPFVDQDVCMAEGLVDISGPIVGEQLRSSPDSPDYGNYYYAGPRTTQENQGVWGRNYVVDPLLNQGVGYDQFVAERVYADNGSNWMEAGWIEKSWLDDRQYIYAMDSNVPESIVYDEFNISTGSEVETQVYYNTEIGKWRATYHLGGGYWAVLREENIGFSIAENGYNRAEFWENIGVLPLMPPSKFDKGYLLIDGVWRIWDTRFNTVVAGENDGDPYRCEMISEFHQFTVHSPMIFLPLVMKD